MKSRIIAFAGLLLLMQPLFFCCNQPDRNQTQDDMPTEETLERSTAAADGSVGNYNDGKYNLTARLDKVSNGDYIITATLSNVSGGGITLTKDKLHVFEDTTSTDANKEIIQVRELVFTYSPTGTSLSQQHTVKASSIQQDEVVTVTIHGLYTEEEQEEQTQSQKGLEKIDVPRKPKVVVVRILPGT